MVHRAEILDGPAAVRTAGEAWRETAVAGGNAFVTPEWFTAWYAHYGEDVEAAIVVVRDTAGDVVGVLPLARQGTELRFAGANVGDRFEPVARPGHLLEVAAAAGRVIGETWPQAHLVLHNVDDGASWVPELVGATGRLSLTPLRGGVLPYVELGGSWDDYLATRSRNFRNQVGRKERNLVKQHSARFRTADDPARVAADMKTFFALHEARWTDHEGGSSLTTPAVQAFHADFAAAALDRGWLRLTFLEAGDSEVAGLYGWRLGGRSSYFNAGWEPGFAESSVGLVLLAHAIRSACEEGAVEYDLLLGDEGYKYRFATGERPVRTVVAARPLGRAHLLARADATLRRATDDLSPETRARLKALASGVVRVLPGQRLR